MGKSSSWLINEQPFTAVLPCLLILINLPESDLLMELASFSCWGVAFVFANLSDPAKSINENFPFHHCSQANYQTSWFIVRKVKLTYFTTCGLFYQWLIMNHFKPILTTIRLIFFILLIFSSRYGFAWCINLEQVPCSRPQWFCSLLRAELKE